MAPNRAYSVYEAINPRRGVAVIGVSDSKDVKGVRESHLRMPPLCMAGWNADERVQYRIVENGLSLREALQAAARHGMDRRLSNLRVHVVS